MALHEETSGNKANRRDKYRGGMTSMLKQYQYPPKGKVTGSDYWHSYPGLVNREKPGFFKALGPSPFRLFIGEDNAGFTLPAPTVSAAVTTRPGNESRPEFFHLNLQFQLRFSLQASISTLVHRKDDRGILLKTSKVKENKSLVHNSDESLESSYHLGGFLPVPGLTSPHWLERLLHPKFFSPARLPSSVLQRGRLTNHSPRENASRDDCDEADKLQSVTAKTDASGQKYETDASVLMVPASPSKGRLRAVPRSELVSSNVTLPGARNRVLNLLPGNNPLIDRTKVYQRMISVADELPSVAANTDTSGQKYETDASVLMVSASPSKGRLRAVPRSELVSSNVTLPGGRNRVLNLLPGKPLIEQTKVYRRMVSVAKQFARYESALKELSPLQTRQAGKAHAAIRDLQTFQHFFATENKRYNKEGGNYKDQVEQRLSESVVSELRQQLVDLQRANSADSKALLQAVQTLAEVVEHAVMQNSAGQSSTMRPLNFLGPL